MKKLFYRFFTRLIAVFEVLTYRTFTLQGTYSKPDDFEHITHGTDITEQDY